jgi:diacylglycerol kinase family enzyme
MIETLFIVNPVAGGKRGIRRWKVFEIGLRDRDFRFHVGLTDGPGHAQELSESAVRNGLSVVAFGGDGTLNEVLNGFMRVPVRCRGSARLGYVPAGSSNDFLRSLGVSPVASLDHIAQGDPITLDVGRIECRDRNGDPAERYFLVNASMGVLPGALEYFNRQRLLKLISLDLTVVASGLNSIIRHKTRSYRLSFDGNSPVEGRYTNLSILKGIWFGGGMSYGSEGMSMPGKFSVIGINNMSKLGRAVIMPRFYTNTILKHPAVWKRSCSQCEVTSDSHGIVEADGELVGFLPARFTVLRNSLELVVWKEHHEPR